MGLEKFFEKATARMQGGYRVAPLDASLRHTQLENALYLNLEIRDRFRLMDSGCEEVVLEAMARWRTFSPELMESMYVYEGERSDVRRAYAGILQHNFQTAPANNPMRFITDYLQKPKDIPKESEGLVEFVGYELAYFSLIDSEADGHAVGLIPKIVVPPSLHVTYNLHRKNQFLMIDTLDDRIIFGISYAELEEYIKKIGLSTHSFELETFYIPKDPAQLLAQFSPAMLGMAFS